MGAATGTGTGSGSGWRATGAENVSVGAIDPLCAEASFDRRSSFSLVSRASSASTSSRNWSTSPMS